MFTHKGSDELYEYDVADDDYAGKNDVRELVSKALMQIDPKFRSIVVMRMLQGYSTKETSEILSLPVGTVLSRLSRAQEQLREILKNQR